MVTKATGKKTGTRKRELPAKLLEIVSKQPIFYNGASFYVVDQRDDMYHAYRYMKKFDEYTKKEKFEYNMLITVPIYDKWYVLMR